MWLSAAIRSRHVVMLPAIQLFLLPCSYIPYPVWLNCPASVPASYHERGHFIALGLQPLLSLLLYLRVMPITFLLGFNRTSLSLLRTADASTRDGRSCMDQHLKHIRAVQSPRLIEVMGSLTQSSSFIRCSLAQMSIGGY